jgi:hypothetical protein
MVQVAMGIDQHRVRLPEKVVTMKERILREVEDPRIPWAENIPTGCRQALRRRMVCPPRTGGSGGRGRAAVRGARLPAASRRRPGKEGEG